MMAHMTLTTETINFAAPAAAFERAALRPAIGSPTKPQSRWFNNCRKNRHEYVSPFDCTSANSKILPSNGSGLWIDLPPSKFS
jgi:hypothetical protein